MVALAPGADVDVKFKMWSRPGEDLVAVVVGLRGKRDGASMKVRDYVLFRRAYSILICIGDRESESPATACFQDPVL